MKGCLLIFHSVILGNSVEIENQFGKINGHFYNLKRDGVIVCDRILADLKDLKKKIQDAKKKKGILNILLDISF